MKEVKEYLILVVIVQMSIVTAIMRQQTPFKVFRSHNFYFDLQIYFTNYYMKMRVLSLIYQ